MDSSSGLEQMRIKDRPQGNCLGRAQHAMGDGRQRGIRMSRATRIEEEVVVILTTNSQLHASGQPDFVRRRPTQGIEIGNQLRQDDRG